MIAEARKNIDNWLSGSIDEDTKAEIRKLQDTDEKELEDAFYRSLEFGTGGLRGLMGAGTNRMNKYTVGMATQGYANYLIKSFGNEIKVAVAHDSRNNSRKFAEITSAVFAANGIEVYLFEDLRPTPELSYAIRHYGCKGGVVCTASHNPKEYNGYKAYWDDGAQLVPPHDAGVIKEVDKITSPEDVRWKGNEEKIKIIGKETDESYLKMLKGLSIYPDVIAKQHDLKIVYTSIHGTGITLVPAALKTFGFTNVEIVDAQKTPDGNFPTVAYPNPEEKETMSIGLKQAENSNADILCGTDPDADRVGIGLKNDKGDWILMNGNQTALLAFNYLMEARKEKGIAQPNDMVIKTIVTTDMIDRIAEKQGVKCYNVLTGFKWIASMIREKEGTENYVIGGEESFGLMIGDQIRDKDAVSAVCVLCEMAAYEKSKGRSLFDKLIDLYVEYGLYKEDLVSITKKGMTGNEEIAKMMDGYRNTPPTSLGGSAVVAVYDYLSGIKKSVKDTTDTKIDLPKSNVLQFELADGSKISARPSGTEPKIKFYFSVNTKLDSKDLFYETEKKLDAKIAGIRTDLGI